VNLFILKEALASVALSHEEGHDCDVCRAASGDKDALIRVMLDMQALRGQAEGTPSD